MANISEATKSEEVVGEKDVKRVLLARKGVYLLANCATRKIQFGKNTFREKYSLGKIHFR